MVKKHLIMMTFIMAVILSVSLNVFAVNAISTQDVELHYYNQLNTTSQQELYNHLSNSIINKNKLLFIHAVYDEDNIHSVLNAIVRDHPEFISFSGNVTAKTFFGFTIITLHYEKIDEKVALDRSQEIANTLKNDDIETQLEKLYTLLEQVEYSNETFSDSTLYGALIDNNANCEGYSEAFSHILNLLGVENYIKTGYVNDGNHQWNAVNVNGLWYEFDVTFDATDKNGVRDYFMVSNAH